jgi:phosphatidylglycerophosphatase A
VNEKGLVNFIYKLLATFFYIGYIPYAPGTAASLVSAIILFFLPTISPLLFLGFLVTLFFVGVAVAKKLAFWCNDSDPSIVVIDEVLGMSLSIFMLPKLWWMYGLAFCFFRIFDIFKPCFIKKVEKIREGWGIMLDDFWAGILTLGVINCIRLFIGF